MYLLCFLPQSYNALMRLRDASGQSENLLLAYSKVSYREGELE